MSRFTVMVIGDNAEEQLERYDENVEVEEYEVGEVSQNDKQDMINYYAKKGHKFPSFSRC